MVTGYDSLSGTVGHYRALPASESMLQDMIAMTTVDHYRPLPGTTGHYRPPAGVNLFTMKGYRDLEECSTVITTSRDDRLHYTITIISQ